MLQIGGRLSWKDPVAMPELPQALLRRLSGSLQVGQHHCRLLAPPSSPAVEPQRYCVGNLIRDLIRKFVVGFELTVAP
jgi:hypothetical protein